SPNCTCRGRSKPSAWRVVATTSGGESLDTMSSTGSPERWTSPKTTRETPIATAAAWPSRRRRNGSASGLHVRLAHVQHVVGTHPEALHLPGHSEQLVQLPEEEPHRLVVEAGEGLGPQLLPPLRVERALVLLDRLEQVARRVEVPEGREVGLEALHGVGGVPGAVDERVVEAVLVGAAAGPLVVLGPLQHLHLRLHADLVPVARDDLRGLLGQHLA